MAMPGDDADPKRHSPASGFFAVSDSEVAVPCGPELVSNPELSSEPVRLRLPVAVWVLLGSVAYAGIIVFGLWITRTSPIG
jgi:hypothetical protein